MRLKDMSIKEVIDISRGKKLGTPGSLDVMIDEHTGKVKELIFPTSPALPFQKKQKEWAIPWGKIERIGEDYIILK